MQRWQRLTLGFGGLSIGTLALSLVENWLVFAGAVVVLAALFLWLYFFGKKREATTGQ